MECGRILKVAERSQIIFQSALHFVQSLTIHGYIGPFQSTTLKIVSVYNSILKGDVGENQTNP